LLPFFERYNWGRKCCTSVIMTLWPTHTSIHDITTRYPKPAEVTIWLVTQKVYSWLTFKDFWFATCFHKTHLIHMTTSEESLRVLFHRSGTLDWHVTKATSAKSSRLIHTFLDHSSIAIFYCNLLLFCTSLSFNLSLP
jgi:hypothetical protein